MFVNGLNFYVIFFILVFLGYDGFFGYFCLGRCRNLWLCCYLLVKYLILILWEMLFVMLSFLGICFYWVGFELVWIFLIFIEMNGLKCCVLLYIYVNMILLFRKKIFCLNFRWVFFFMVMCNWEVNIVSWSLRWGIVKFFMGVVFDFVVIRCMLNFLFFSCYFVYV